MHGAERFSEKTARNRECHLVAIADITILVLS